MAATGIMSIPQLQVTSVRNILIPIFALVSPHFALGHVTLLSSHSWSYSPKGGAGSKFREGQCNFGVEQFSRVLSVRVISEGSSRVIFCELSSMYLGFLRTPPPQLLISPL